MSVSAARGRPDDSQLPPLMEALMAVLARRAARYSFKPNPRRRAAGVLVLFYLRAERLHLLLFRRTEKVPTHKGQVAFPGGSREAADVSLEETAMREAREELGVDTDRVVRLGPLKPFETFVSNFVVSPFCGWLVDPDPLFTAQPFEVEDVLEVAVDDLRRQENRHRGLVPGFNVPFPLPYYRVDGTIIWGATGGIVEELVEALDEAEAMLA
ncbi:MAG: CoA pyrophosphatase [Candidatus Dormibacteria bacterium]